jgi:Fic family protein
LIDTAPNLKIDFNEICTLHYLLSDGLVLPQYSGKIRDHGVRISGSTYIPLENPKEIEKQLKRICAKATKIQNPFETGIFLLTHIAYLQAFIDINKRTSRLSANIPLIKSNAVPLSFNDIEKEDYNSAMLAVYELNQVEPLAELFNFSYIRSCQQYNLTVNTIEYDEIRVRFRSERRDILRHIITNKLTGNKLKNYLEKQKQLIPTEHQQHFYKNVKEDLKEIDLQRIAGLGVTPGQLQAWLKLQKE